MPKKRDAPPELVEQVSLLETQCDNWGERCVLFRREWNLAAWHGLTFCARSLEQSVRPNDRGGPQHQLAATNISRVAYQIYRAARRHGFSKIAGRSRMRWNLPESMLIMARDQAFSYSMCCVDFPAWHENIYSATHVDNTSIKFDAAPTERSQRVVAYEKGFRPAKLRHKIGKLRAEIKQDPDLRSLIEQIVPKIKKRGQFGFLLPNLDKLHLKLVQAYRETMDQLYRRSPNIELGGYSMAEFKVFYAALLAMAGA